MSGKQKAEIREVAATQEPKAEVKQDKFPAEILAKSKTLSEFGLHRDIIRAILDDAEYTVEDAKKAIQNYIDSFNH
jgi:hypothetical protein